MYLKRLDQNSQMQFGKPKHPLCRVAKNYKSYFDNNYNSKFPGSSLEKMRIKGMFK